MAHTWYISGVTRRYLRDVRGFFGGKLAPENSWPEGLRLQVGGCRCRGFRVDVKYGFRGFMV